MSEQNALTWWDRLRGWIHERTRPHTASSTPQPVTDEHLRAAWEPLAQVTPHSWRANALLDVPLAPHAGMSKVWIWSRFVDWLVDREDGWISDDEQTARPPRWTTMDAATMQPLTDAEADERHARMMAWWSHHQEPALRPSDDAAAVSVWLWRNGLRDQAVDVYARIWQKVCDRRLSEDRLPWPAESALRGFRSAAYRDWDDGDQAEFDELFTQRYVTPGIDDGLGNLTQ